MSDPDTPGRFISCTRADRSHATGAVIEDITEQLVESDIVIADLSGRNANVFYELGVRHATNVNTILISQSEEDVPFDLRHLRTFFYKYEPDSMLELQDHLRSAIAEIVRDRERIDNPVRRYLFDRESRKLRQTAGLPGYDVLRDIMAELSRMRRDITNELGRVQVMLRTAASDDPQLDSEIQHRLRLLQGVWRKADGTGLYCAKVVRNELLIPYCYDYGNTFDSHFYNVRLLGDVLFARFAWFEHDIAGVALLNIVSDKELVGRWWYDADIPAHTDPDEALLRQNFGSSHGIRLLRDQNASFPTWAERYFSSPALHAFRGQRDLEP